MADMGSNPIILFANCWACMKLPDDLIHNVTEKVIRFNSYKSNPKGWTTLIVSLMGKHMAMNLLLMN